MRAVLTASGTRYPCPRASTKLSRRRQQKLAAEEAAVAASPVVGFAGVSSLFPSVSGELDAELNASPGQACLPPTAGVLKRGLHRFVGIGTPRAEDGTGVGSLGSLSDPGCVTESGCILDPECVTESADPGRVTEPVFAQDSVPAAESVSDWGHVTESRCIPDLIVIVHVRKV